MKRKSDGFAFFLLFCFLAAAIGGWIVNIGKIFNLFDGGVSAELLIRIVGVFVAPIGSIAGYM